MRALVISAAAAIGVAIAAPAFAQGIEFGVNVGGPGYHRYGYVDDGPRHRNWDRGYRSYARGDCRNVRIERERPDGSVVIRQIRRCD